jgi:tRNA nucleotidyltransferase/poly(A) polymerase
MDDLLNWRSRVAPAQREIFEAAVAAAGDTGVDLYTAGGPVRDLLLGIPFVDIDLVVEHEGEGFADSLAGRLGGRVQSFPRFLTWRVDIGDGTPIDITTARTEIYRQPGALPSVAASTIHQDLFRRDFAANAVALNLLSGETIDPAGGIADIREGILRVLHPRSFIDDPTRMLRGIRIATRLRFSFDADTAKLISRSAEMAALTTISRERVWREILIAIADSEPAETLIALRRWGLLDPFLETSFFDDNLLRHAGRQLSLAAGIDREVVFAGVLLEGAAQPDRTLEGAGFSVARKKKAVALVDDARLLSRQLAEANTAREGLRLCARASDEVKVVAAAVSDHAKGLILRFAGYEKLALGFRGDELELPPGPHIARALEAAREAVFLDLIPPGEALAFARNIGLQYLRDEKERDSGA